MFTHYSFACGPVTRHTVPLLVHSGLVLSKGSRLTKRKGPQPCSLQLSQRGARARWHGPSYPTAQRLQAFTELAGPFQRLELYSQLTAVIEDGSLGQRRKIHVQGDREGRNKRREPNSAHCSQLGESVPAQG